MTRLHMIRALRIRGEAALIFKRSLENDVGFLVCRNRKLIYDMIRALRIRGEAALIFKRSLENDLGLLTPGRVNSGYEPVTD